MIFGGKHEGEALLRLTPDRFDGRGRCVAGHCPGIAETEIEVSVPVDVGEVRATALLYEDRKATGPLGHPVHRHAFEQMRPGAFSERPGFRVRRLEAALLFDVQPGESGSVNHAWLDDGLRG